MTPKIFLGAAAAALSLGALQVPAADAHGAKWHRGPVIIISGPAPGFGCGDYYWKWKATGSFFWKKKYFVCSGIW